MQDGDVRMYLLIFAVLMNKTMHVYICIQTHIHTGLNGFCTHFKDSYVHFADTQMYLHYKLT